MNNKFKQIFALLFIVATLLLMIGSVSAANAVELDENLEASIVVDDDSAIDDDGFIPNLDDKVSSQTINDDETCQIPCCRRDSRRGRLLRFHREDGADG